jgi:hypothetical protein
VTRTQEGAADDTAVFAAVPPEDVDDVEDRDDGLAAELAKAAPRRWWNRGTLVLGALALLLGGFLGGVQVQKSYGATATAGSNRPAGFTGQNRGTGGYPGFAGGQAPGGAAPTASAAAAGTAGTVKLVDGNTIYVQTADGTVVTVKTNGKTTVRTASKGALKDVKAGQTVTVTGGADADGTVTATAVTAEGK